MLIEKIGVFHEMSGVQPAAARIMGLLYVSDNIELTFEQITEALMISKSATSNGINFLLNLGHIEYTTYLGDRKRYFRLKISNWRESFTKKIESMTNFNKVLEDVLEVRTKETVAFNKSLSEFIDFLVFINKELPAQLQKWEKSRE
ncbi:GbsR/MarR family transcriptional regulator [Peijinzhouia sedimentorum]